MVDEEYKESILHVHRTENPSFQDSIEIGKESTGKLKVYFNSSNPDESVKRLENAFGLLKSAQEKMYGKEER